MQGSIITTHRDERALIVWLAMFGSVPVGALLEPIFEELFNVPDPKWSAESLRRLLVDLELNGLVEFVRGKSLVELSEKALVESLVPSDISTRSQSLQYRLTMQGGIYWEKLFVPVWQDAILYELLMPAQDPALILQLESESDTELIKLVELLNSRGVKLSLSEGRLENLSPWHPTYWKSLVKGVRFSTTNESWMQSAIFDYLPKWHRAINLSH